MEKFELTDFSGGQQERFSAADFKPNEWAKLKGFVVEDSRTIRSQWGIQQVGTFSGITNVQSIAGLTTSNGTDYLFGWEYIGIDPIYQAPGDYGVWRLAYKRVSFRNTVPIQIPNPTIIYGDEWSDQDLDDIATDWAYVRKSDGSIVQYGADDGSVYIYHTAGPRFLCTVPYYNVTGTATTALLASCTAAGTQTKSYLVYEGTGYNGSPFVVKEYTNYLPTATADTDANGDGVLDNGGALIVSSNVMPRATVGTYWRGQLILGDVEYFTNPKELEEAYNDAYSYYTGVYRDWLNARTEYKRANGQAASYPITAPSAIATLQLDRGLAYVQAYKTYIVAWKAKFEENKATSSNVGFPTAPSTGNYAAGSVKRYRNGLWFSQPGTIDQFHPFAFTADICPPDAQIVGFVPVEDGLIVITTSNTKDAVILLRGNSLGYMSDEGAVINVRVETVPGAIGSKVIESAITPNRACYWSKNSSAVYLGRDGSVQITNGSQTLEADTFTESQPINLEVPGGGLYSLSLLEFKSAGSLPTFEQVYAFKNYIFLSRGFRCYIMTQLDDNSFAWSELQYPFPVPEGQTATSSYISPRHMLDLGGNLYFLGYDGNVYRMLMHEFKNPVASERGKIKYLNLATSTGTTTRQRTTTLVTVGVTSTSGFSSGNTIYVKGLGAAYDGLQTVASVNTVNSTITYYKAGTAESQVADTDGAITKITSGTSYPELTISTQTLQGNDYYEKSFWHRVGVRVKQVYNGASGTLVRIVTRNAPAKATTSVSHTTTLNSAITERGELVAPTHGPSVEFSADIVFTGDVSVEGVTVYKHGRTPRRQ